MTKKLLKTIRLYFSSLQIIYCRLAKGTDFSGITDEFVARVEEKLNNRPRKRLGYLTPNEKFNLLLTN